jgi:hypothetical protein
MGSAEVHTWGPPRTETWLLIQVGEGGTHVNLVSRTADLKAVWTRMSAMLFESSSVNYLEQQAVDKGLPPQASGAKYRLNQLSGEFQRPIYHPTGLCPSNQDLIFGALFQARRIAFTAKSATISMLP